MLSVLASHDQLASGTLAFRKEDELEKHIAHESNHSIVQEGSFADTQAEMMLGVGSDSDVLAT